MTELDGWEQIPATTAGGTYEDVSARLVWHMTQGWSLDGAVAAYRGHSFWPHGTVDFVTRRRAQHYPLGVSARALKNLAGGVETGRCRAIQIEIVGFSEYAQDISDDDLDWLGTDVLAPLRAAAPWPIQLVAPKFVGTEAGTIAIASAPQRMSFETWLGFNGVCGHQHVPENDHWDPGRLNVGRILTAADPLGDDVTNEDIMKVTAAVTEALRPVIAAEVAEALKADPVLDLLLPLLREKDDIAYHRLKGIVQRAAKAAQDPDVLAQKIVARLPKDGKATTTTVEAAVRSVLDEVDDD